MTHRRLELPELSHGGTLSFSATVGEQVAVLRKLGFRVTNIEFQTQGWPVPYKVEFWHGGTFFAALSPVIQSWGTSMRVAPGASLIVAASVESAEPVQIDLTWEPLDG